MIFEYFFWHYANLSLKYFNEFLYSQSLLIPTAKHFLNLQNWHRLRLSLITKHFPSRKHRYSICFWMLRRKNPYEKLFLIVCNDANKENFHFFKILKIHYLTTLTRRYTVVISWKKKKQVIFYRFSWMIP